MIRLFTVAALMLISHQAGGQEQAIFLESSNGGYVDLGDGQRFPVVLAIDGARPIDCPEGAYWSESIEVGSIVSECDGDSQYRVIAPSSLSSWSLMPWPRPVDDDDAGPRTE